MIIKGGGFPFLFSTMTRQRRLNFVILRRMEPGDGRLCLDY